MLDREGEVLVSPLIHLVARGDAAAHEPVEPVVRELPVVPPEAGVARVAAGAAPPVEPDRRVGVVAEGEVVAQVLHGAAVARAVAHQLRDAEARREEAAPPPGAHVLEDEGKPEHRHLADVEHRRPGDHDPPTHHLEVARLEVVVRLIEVAAGDGAVVAVKAGRALAVACPEDAGPVGAHVPGLAALHRGGHVPHRPLPRAHVVADPRRADVVLPLGRVAQGDEAVPAAAHLDLAGGVVVDDGVAHDHGLSLLDPRRVAGEDDAPRADDEGDLLTLVSRRREPLPPEERLEHRIGLRPLDERALRTVGRHRVGAGGVTRDRVAREGVAGRARRVGRCPRRHGAHGRLRLEGRRARSGGQEKEGDEQPRAAPGHASAPSPRPAASSRSRRASLRSRRRWTTSDTSTLASYSR